MATVQAQNVANAQQSLACVKLLLRTSLSNVLHLRAIFPQDAFISRQMAGVEGLADLKARSGAAALGAACGATCSRSAVVFRHLRCSSVRRASTPLTSLAFAPTQPDFNDESREVLRWIELGASATAALLPAQPTPGEHRARPHVPRPCLAHVGSCTVAGPARRLRVRVLAAPVQTRSCSRPRTPGAAFRAARSRQPTRSQRRDREAGPGQAGFPDLRGQAREERRCAFRPRHTSAGSVRPSEQLSPLATTRRPRCWSSTSSPSRSHRTARRASASA